MGKKNHIRGLTIEQGAEGKARDKVLKMLHENGIGVNVHYIPVHLHPYYRKHLEIGTGLCPAAESAYEEIISLPIFPGRIELIQPI